MELSHPQNGVESSSQMWLFEPRNGYDVAPCMLLIWNASDFI